MPAKATAQKRRISREGLLLIKSFEGFRPRAVPRRDGTLIIGYGHTRSAREGIEISEAEAELLLLHDLLPIVACLNTEIRYPLTQPQFDALASFVFSIGISRFNQSQVLQLVRRGLTDAAAEALAAEPERTQPPLDIQWRRRSAEKAMFQTSGSKSPDLSQLLVAPIRRPAPVTTPPEDAQLGTVGVLRHEMSPTRDETSIPPSKTAETVDTGTIVLAGGVGVLVSLAALMAFKRGLNVPIEQNEGMLIGASLCALGAILVVIAGWAFRRRKTLRKRTA